MLHCLENNLSLYLEVGEKHISESRSVLNFSEEVSALHMKFDIVFCGSYHL